MGARRAVWLALIVLLVYALIARHVEYRQILVTVAHMDGQSEVDVKASEVRRTQQCKVAGLQLYREREGPRRVYDLVMVGTEFDWLSIRLHELYDVVDYFVLVESDKTFTGRPKPLTVHENWQELSLFHDKIIYHVLNDTGVVFKTAWEREDFQRNAMLNQVFPYLSGRQAAQRDDVLMVSDVDEIPRPAIVDLLRSCQFPKRLTLKSKFYYYSFQWLHRGNDWAHPQATYYADADTIRPNDLRIADSDTLLGKLLARFQKGVIENAGWHCSSCFATLEDVRNKMSSFSHTSWNKDEYRTTESLVHKFRNGLDLFERSGEIYDRIDNNTDVPSYILKHTIQLSYMLDRDVEGANFRDLNP